MVNENKLNEIKEIYQKYSHNYSLLEKKKSNIFINFIKKMEHQKMNDILSSIKQAN